MGRTLTSYDRVVDRKALEIQNNANDKIADKQTEANRILKVWQLMVS